MLPKSTASRSSSACTSCRALLWCRNPGSRAPQVGAPLMATSRRRQPILDIAKWISGRESEKSEGSMIFDALREAIRHEIQADVVLEESLEACQHEREPLRRVGRLLHELVGVSAEARVRYADER